MFEGWQDCIDCLDCIGLINLWITCRKGEDIPDELKFEGWKTPWVCEEFL